jgi:uncharacterized protein
MPVTFNLRHLDDQDLPLSGEISPEELEITDLDELVKARHNLVYDLEVQKFETNILVRGRLTLPLDCECVRCLKPFTQTLELADWQCLLPLEGEDAVPVVNDIVDLTPLIREDMLLNFPQHPLCEEGCEGLKKPAESFLENEKSNRPGVAAEGSPTWAALDKLKLEK